MTTSPLPWTIEVINWATEPESPSAHIKDQAGNPIGTFNDIRDAELVLEQFERVKGLEEKTQKLECDIEKLENQKNNLCADLAAKETT